MNTELILNSNIQNIAIAYGGVRGTTLSSRHNMRYWQRVVDSGVRTIIELRDADHSDRLCKMCEMYGIRYFAFPLDSHSVPNEVISLICPITAPTSDFKIYSHKSTVLLRSDAPKRSITCL